MTIWIDVEDLFDYFRFNPHPSGIQRVAVALSRALVAGGGVRMLRHEGVEGLAREARWEDVETMLATPPAPEQSRDDGPVDDIERRTQIQRRILRMAPELRGPLFRAGVLQSQVLHNVRLLARARQAPSLARRAVSERVVGSGAQLAAGDCYLMLGAPWSVPGSTAVMAAMRAQGVRIGLLIHDVIPVRRPEWQAPARVAHFRAWLEASLTACDAVLTLSQFTARDVQAYAAERGIALAAAVRTIPAGTTPPPDAAARSEGFPVPDSYVLYVSTLEARKNHALAVRIWQQLMAEVRAGTRAAESVPMLVFAGRVGLGVADLMQQLDNSRWLNGRVRLYRDPSDAELRALYEGCRFTLMPSLYEGWGLPLQESLLLGKPCLAAGNTALPEAGGDLCRYFDPEEGTEAHRAVADLLDDPAEVAAWQGRVRVGFAPRAWDAAAEAVRAALAA